MNTMNLVAGLDIGNGYVKGAVNLKENLKNKPKSIDFPSGVARIIYPKDIKTEVSEAGYVIDDIFNQLRALVDDRHPVIGGELLRQRKPHLTGTHDNDIHRLFS